MCWDNLCSDALVFCISSLHGLHEMYVIMILVILYYLVQKIRNEGKARDDLCHCWSIRYCKNHDSHQYLRIYLILLSKSLDNYSVSLSIPSKIESWTGGCVDCITHILEVLFSLTNDGNTSNVITTIRSGVITLLTNKCNRFGDFPWELSYRDGAGTIVASCSAPTRDIGTDEDRVGPIRNTRQVNGQHPTCISITHLWVSIAP